jgi:hypothetical protein
MTKPELTADGLRRSGFKRIGCWELSNEQKLTYPIDLPSLAGVYAFAVDGIVQYVGLASKSLRQRFGFYRNPGPRQQTNIRLNDIISGQIRQGAVVEILIAHPPDHEWNGFKVRGSEGLEAGLISEFNLPWNVRGSTAAPPQFLKKEQPSTRASDRILNVVGRRPGLTELELAKAIFGPSAVQQLVNKECRSLVELGLLERRGVGGKADPFVYHPGKGTPLSIVRRRLISQRDSK